MSEHRRKPPQSRGRRTAQPPSPGRRAAPPSGATTSSYGAPAESPYSSRAEARRAAQRGGRRRAAASSPADAGGGGYAGGGGRGRRGGGGDVPRGGGGRGRRPEPPGKKRFIDYPRSGKYGLRRWLPSWKQIAGMCVAFLGLIVGLAGVALAMVEPPNESDAAKAQNNVYYWADGSVMARDGQTNRQNVDISKIPKEMQDAVIAAENATFYEDSGIDPKGIARAMVNMARGQETQGGSTITQQFVKNTFLSQDQTLTRKVKELFISIKVGSQMSKPKILQGYLNTSYYGRGAYGIQAAAQAYYNKNAEELEPDESALLATVLKGADLYDPAGGEGPYSSRKENRKRAEKRWEWILDRQVEVGRMELEERKKFQEFPEPVPRKDQSSKSGQVGYLMAVAKNEVMNKGGIEKKQFDRGGYQIYTTFDRKKVETLEKTVNQVRKDNIDPEEREADTFVQFGAASVVPNDGKIVAIYGGEGYDKGHYLNNANTLGVPVGSTWKPFVLAAAMTHGTYKSEGQPISPDSEYNGDNKIKIKNQDGSDYLNKKNEPFRQVNFKQKDWDYISLRKAMEVSANTPFVQLGMDVGMQKVKEMAMSAGIKEESIDRNLNPSFALGTSTPSAIRMADAYATFAASGKQAEPYSVKRVVYAGEDWGSFEKPARKASIDANVANNVTEVLENVIKGPNGSGKAARALNRPAAGKTGTTDDNKSAWWVGYTPQLSTSVTMFRTDPNGDGTPLSMYGVGGEDAVTGGGLPAKVWTDYMKAALKGKAPEPFPKAEPIGEKVDQDGAPTPTPTETETPEEEEPEEEPTESATPTESGRPTDEEKCKPGDITCDDPGGETDGQTGGETDGQTGGETDGQTDGPDWGGTTDGQSDGGGDNKGGNGNNGGTIFGKDGESGDSEE
ncbi:transglycosylase domain-containing protein [Streptomyces gobiensis]|uniref:transglycosylase domain-containing protein n=1 Tax=Streptomyces gobiensis TaxID=2875706 RepID=UPI001E5B9AF8|nr:transglycosylase domain-containing protein [Streptomyces gobiensis]UGY92530.1 penicillin-binding protein [Streptomyces gobiensis]